MTTGVRGGTAPGGLLSVTFAITPAIFAGLNVLTHTWTSAALPAGAVLDSYRVDSGVPSGTAGALLMTLGPSDSVAALLSSVLWQGGDSGSDYISATAASGFLRRPVGGLAMVLTLASQDGVTNLSNVFVHPSLGLNVVAYYTIARNMQTLP